MENPKYLFDQQYKKISLWERFLNFIGIEGKQMNTTNIRLEGYEVTQEIVTGFKVYRDQVQVATIEKRNNEWIGAITAGTKVMMFQNENFEEVLNKINKLTV